MMKLGALLVVATGCHPSAGTTPPVTNAMPVRVRFAAVVDGQPFTCGTRYPGIGSTASTITPTDFRMFVSDAMLVRADGTAVPIALEQDGRWQVRNVALLDFEDARGPCANGTAGTHTEITGSVPPGTYRALRFTVGLPFDLNHGDPTRAPAPLNQSSMFWVWQAGYRFVKIDLTTSAAADSAGFPVHLGSAGCTSAGMTKPPTSCTFPNTPTVTLDDFDLGRDIVVADLAALLRGTNIDTNAPNTVHACERGHASALRARWCS